MVETPPYSPLNGRPNYEKTLLPYPAGCRTAIFLRREKRFFVTVKMDGREVLTHTNNTGRMQGLLEPGSPVLLSPAENPKRKLHWTVEALGTRDGGWVGVNTLVPNRLLSALFNAGLLPWAMGYTQLIREAPCGESRLDGKLLGHDLPPLWVECKNVTLVFQKDAAFPDAPTERGLKHLGTLCRLKNEGARAAMLYVVQRTDAEYFRAADEIDPRYGIALREAAQHGVEIHALMFEINEEGIRFKKELPVKI